MVVVVVVVDLSYDHSSQLLPLNDTSCSSSSSSSSFSSLFRFRRGKYLDSLHDLEEALKIADNDKNKKDVKALIDKCRSKYMEVEGERVGMKRVQVVEVEEEEEEEEEEEKFVEVPEVVSGLFKCTVVVVVVVVVCSLLLQWLCEC